MSRTTRQGDAGGFWSVLPPVGPGAHVEIPSSANGLFDYEAELAVVLSKGSKRIRAEDWRDHISGAVLVIDWSVRADQLADTARPFYGHKVFDGSKSLGPFASASWPDPETAELRVRPLRAGLVGFAQGGASDVVLGDQGGPAVVDVLVQGPGDGGFVVSEVDAQHEQRAARWAMGEWPGWPHACVRCLNSYRARWYFR
ncbi:fumarylacetoacetate hydrolase family protein [Nocardia carnea]|uniref:fumarylacetoacetate hydrolase family protein n=1 Tax=Nocardia carnea TaxID=37328 RepID=UPI0024565DB2|nr:fumarylacetoacetate hydrolase family protein [Nocardia carnea]